MKITHPRLTGMLARVLFTAVGVVAASMVGRWLASTTDSLISPFWPASGVAVGAALLWGWPALLGVFSGILFSNVYSGMPGMFASLGSVSFALETALATAIVRLVLGKKTRLDDLRGVLAIVIGAAWLPPLLNAMISGRLLPVGDGTPFLSTKDEIVRFVLANGFGIALIAPSMLVWSKRSQKDWLPKALIALAGTALTVWVCFGLGFPTTLILIPLVGAALGTGLKGAGLVCAITATGIVVLSGAGLGSLVTPQGVDYARVYAIFAVMAFGILPIGAASGEYQRLLRQRRNAERAAGLKFWEWNDKEGLRFGGNGHPEKLFDASRDSGMLETKSNERDALSFWQIVSRRADGAPAEVTGMLVDASEHVQLEKTRRAAWKSEVELRNLRASLTPHLLFNCLAAVRGIVRTDPEKARLFIDALSRFLRDSMEAQGHQTIPMNEEWQLCEDFLDLQSLRYERELPRLIEIEGAVHRAQIPPMMLLTLVENAVKHGEISQKHPLVVRAALDDGRLVAEVCNHGELGPAEGRRSGGLGTASARLQAIYGTKASLALRQKENDVSASLELPAEAQGQDRHIA